MVQEFKAEADFALGDTLARQSPGRSICAPAHPDWLVTTDGNRVKISNIRTGALIANPANEVRTTGSSICLQALPSLLIVIVADFLRAQVLRLVASADGSSAQVEFARSISNGGGSDEELKYPTALIILPAVAPYQMRRRHGRHDLWVCIKVFSDCCFAISEVRSVKKRVEDHRTLFTGCKHAMAQIDTAREDPRILIPTPDAR